MLIDVTWIYASICIQKLGHQFEENKEGNMRAFGGSKERKIM